MTPERFRELWLETNTGLDLQDELREALTAVVEEHARAEDYAHHLLSSDAEHYAHPEWKNNFGECRLCTGSVDDWLKASWEYWLGRVP